MPLNGASTLYFYLGDTTTTNYNALLSTAYSISIPNQSVVPGVFSALVTPEAVSFPSLHTTGI